MILSIGTRNKFYVFIRKTKEIFVSSPDMQNSRSVITTHYQLSLDELLKDNSTIPIIAILQNAGGFAEM